MASHNIINHGEPKPRAAGLPTPRRVHALERAAHPFMVFHGDPFARVNDVDPHADHPMGPRSMKREEV